VSTVTLFAFSQEGTANVTVDVAGQKTSVQFTVVAPKTVTSKTVGKSHQPDLGRPNGALTLAVYIGPDDVSFYNVKIREEDATAEGHGYWSSVTGRSHHPNPQPTEMTVAVLPGLGTMAHKHDIADSAGADTGGPPWEGWFKVDIPYLYSTIDDSTEYPIRIVRHLVVTDKAGTLTISKAGAKETFKIGDLAVTSDEPLD
jgi:hypothetical protein